MSAQILVVDDDPDAAISLTRALKGRLTEHQIHAASQIERAIEMGRQIHPNVCVMDLNLDESRGVESGFELLERLIALDPSIRVIVLTGHGGIDLGVRALNSGAACFLEKPADITHLSALILDGISQSELRRAYQNLRVSPSETLTASICGRSAAIQRLREEIYYAAQTSQAVLLLGQTGVGKGICARAIHDLSRRSQARFVRWQPSFSTADLVNSELFGHSKGAFTGASEDRRGLLTDAHRGTLFLDEIEELPLETQVTLLGVLQDRSFRPLGSNSLQNSDFRLICASNAVPQELLKQGKLRQDFYHRIAHCVISIPALRERLEDLEDLALNYLQKLRAQEQLNVFDCDSKVYEVLSRHDWPGNVRELEAVVEGAAYRAQLSGRSRIAASDIRINSVGSAPLAANFNELIEQFKLRTIQEALGRHQGNQVQAAKDLGLDRSTLRRILNRHPETTKESL